MWFKHAWTFEELMNRFLSEHASKKRSYRSYKVYAQNLMLFFKGYKLKEITPSLISEYKDMRLKRVKPASVNRELAILKVAFNMAIKQWEWMNVNPVCRIPLEPENNKRVKWLSTEEEGRLMSHCPLWLKPIIETALLTGLRLGELTALTWKDIDLNEKVIYVLSSKNGEQRAIPINDRLCSILLSLKAEGDRVFPYSNSFISHQFKRACHTAKIDDIRFHDLRHCYATSLVRKGVDLYRVSRLLGHKTISMTERYSHLNLESLRQAVSQI